MRVICCLKWLAEEGGLVGIILKCVGCRGLNLLRSLFLEGTGGFSPEVEKRLRKFPS